jgi:hypothetical protein
MLSPKPTLISPGFVVAFWVHPERKMPEVINIRENKANFLIKASS